MSLVFKEAGSRDWLDPRRNVCVASRHRLESLNMSNNPPQKKKKLRFQHMRCKSVICGTEGVNEPLKEHLIIVV